MADKYSNLAELLYASYSGLQMMAFAFSKKKAQYSGSCYAFRKTKFRRKNRVRKMRYNFRFKLKGFRGCECTMKLKKGDRNGT